MQIHRPALPSTLGSSCFTAMSFCSASGCCLPDLDRASPFRILATSYLIRLPALRMPADPFRFASLLRISALFLSTSCPMIFQLFRVRAFVLLSHLLRLSSLRMLANLFRLHAHLTSPFLRDSYLSSANPAAIPVQTTQIPIETFLSFAIPRPLQPFRCYSVSKPCFPNPLLRSVARRNSGSSPGTCLRCFSVSTPFNTIPVRCACRLFSSFSPRTKPCYSFAVGLFT